MTSADRKTRATDRRGVRRARLVFGLCLVTIDPPNHVGHAPFRVDADGASFVFAGGLLLGDALAAAQHNLALPRRHAGRNGQHGLAGRVAGVQPLAADGRDHMPMPRFNRRLRWTAALPLLAAGLPARGVGRAARGWRSSLRASRFSRCTCSPRYGASPAAWSVVDLRAYTAIIKIRGRPSCPFYIGGVIRRVVFR